ncbi:hypothetical protein GCM10022237_01660 [Nocardioides ginsengisoli]
MGMLARLLAAVVTGLLLVAIGAPAHAVPVVKPSPPRAVQAVPADRAITVHWTAPARTGGAKVDRYAIQARQGQTGTWQAAGVVKAAARSWTTRGLVNGTTYGFRVRVHTPNGWSAWSPATYAVPRGLPGAPRFPEADGYLRGLGVYWEAPDANGSPIDRYRVEYSTDGATWTGGVSRTTAPTAEDPVRLTGLTPGTRYYVRVHAHNSAGFGPSSAAGPYRVFTTAGAVTGLAGVPGDGSVALTWDAPAADVAAGVPAATGYRVERSTDGTTWTELATPTATSYPATGLSNGTAYRFRVSARAANGKLGWGPGVVIQPGAPGTAPDAATGLQATSLRTGSQIDNVLTWTAPPNGTPPDYYVIERSVNGEPFEDVAVRFGVEYTDLNVNVGWIYTYRVVSHNAHGTSAASAEATTWYTLFSVIDVHITVTEGQQALGTVSLTPAPTTDTVVPLISDDPSVVVPATVTVPAGQSTATFAIDAPQDDDVEDGYAIVTAAYGDQTMPIMVTVHDDDVQALVLTTETLDLTTGDSGPVGVSLAYRPTSDVTVTIAIDPSAPSDPGAPATVDPTTLTFTHDDWDVPQQVSVQAVAAGSTTITLGAAGVASRQVAVSVTDPVGGP